MIIISKSVSPLLTAPLCLSLWYWLVKKARFSSVQFSCSVVPNSLPPHELQHTRPPCLSQTPRVYSNSCPSSRWCHPAISSSVVPFPSCPQSLPASGSFPMSQISFLQIQDLSDCFLMVLFWYPYPRIFWKWKLVLRVWLGQVKWFWLGEAEGDAGYIRVLLMSGCLTVSDVLIWLIWSLGWIVFEYILGWAVFHRDFP